VFCVFSGRGVVDLRNHLNSQAASYGAEDEFDQETVHDGDDDQTMTGMMGATALNGDDEDADGDEELDGDAESPES
jgi:F-box and leucine-rich repeat protein GRR1